MKIEQTEIMSSSNEMLSNSSLSSSPIILEKPPHPTPLNINPNLNQRSSKSYLEPAPFNDDPIAIERREAVDYSIKITYEEAMTGTARRQVRVYADGVYDMFHSGHARQLMQAKTAFHPDTDVYLIVGMNSDSETHSMKGKTVMTEDERYEVIRHCRYVDEVYRGGPFYPDYEFIVDNKIDFIAHDDAPYPYANGTGDAYEWVKRKGMFLSTKRTPSVSTTQVITRIVSDYDSYLLRNLKRGCSSSELNVSYMKSQRLIAKEKASNVLDNWEHRSLDFISSFIGMFEQGARLLSGHDQRQLTAGPENGEATEVSVTSCDDTDSFADDCDFAEVFHLEVQPVK